MEIRVKCKECNKELNAEVYKDEIEVEFCSDCSEVEYIRGTEQGYEQGFTDGKAESLVCSQPYEECHCPQCYKILLEDRDDLLKEVESLTEQLKEVSKSAD